MDWDKLLCLYRVGSKDLGYEAFTILLFEIINEFIQDLEQIVELLFEDSLDDEPAIFGVEEELATHASSLSSLEGLVLIVYVVERLCDVPRLDQSKLHDPYKLLLVVELNGRSEVNRFHLAHETKFSPIS